MLRTNGIPRLHTQTHTHTESYFIRDAATSTEPERDEARKRVCLSLGAIPGPLALLKALSSALTSCLRLVILPKRELEMAGKHVGVGRSAWLILSA